MSHSSVMSQCSPLDGLPLDDLPLSVQLPTPWGICQLEYHAHTQPLLATLTYGFIDTQLGRLRITLMEQSLVKLAIVYEKDSDERDRDDINGGETAIDDAGSSKTLRDDAAIHRWYQHHFQSKAIPLLKLMVVGTEFQHRVWQGLLLQQAENFPGLKPTTYSQLAEKIAMPRSVRAVANALGANPIAIIIPCHQVLRSDGTLGGYRWGISTKRKLLALVETDWGASVSGFPETSDFSEVSDFYKRAEAGVVV